MVRGLVQIVPLPLALSSGLQVVLETLAVLWVIFFVLGTYEERQEELKKGERESLGFVAPLALPGRGMRGIGAALGRLYERSKTLQVLGKGAGWMSLGVFTVVVWAIALAAVLVVLWLAVNLVGYLFAPDPCSAESDGQASCPQYHWWP